MRLPKKDTIRPFPQRLQFSGGEITFSNTHLFTGTPAQQVYIVTYFSSK